MSKFKSPRAFFSREIFSDSDGGVGASSPGFLWSLFILGAEGFRMVTKHLLSVLTDFFISNLELTLDSLIKDALEGFIVISDQVDVRDEV